MQRFASDKSMSVYRMLDPRGPTVITCGQGRKDWLGGWPPMEHTREGMPARSAEPLNVVLLSSLALQDH
eukprot:1536564-Amphidinium_carterae.1